MKLQKTAKQVVSRKSDKYQHGVDIMLLVDPEADEDDQLQYFERSNSSVESKWLSLNFESEVYQFAKDLQDKWSLRSMEIREDQ